MVVEVNYKDGSRDKYSKVCYAGVLGSRPDCLYIQTRARGIVREVFVRLDTVLVYHIREAIK